MRAAWQVLRLRCASLRMTDLSRHSTNETRIFGALHSEVDLCGGGCGYLGWCYVGG